MTRPSDTAYIYASTKIKSADGTGTEASRLKALLDCSTVRDVYDAVMDSGICPSVEKRSVTSDSDAVLATSQALETALDYAAALVREAIPDLSLYNFLFYKYDCNNIKATIKASLRSVSSEGAMFTCGSISPETVEEQIKNRLFAEFPRNMASAAPEAIDTFERTGETRSIDFILDRACFADMSDNASASGITEFMDYVAALADATNIRSAVRISDSSVAPAAAEALMSRVFVPGGSIPEGTFRAEGGGIASLEEVHRNLPLIPLKAELTNAVDDKGLLDAILEDFVHKTVGDTFSVTFGPVVPAQFFITREREIRRYRKALSILSMGNIKKENLKERLGVL